MGEGQGGGPTISSIASTASIVILHGRTWPSKPGRTALAIAAERILATGSDAEIRALAGPETSVLDAGADLVLPGFNDAHVHFLNGARNLANLELSSETTVDGVLRIAEFSRTYPDREWLLGRGRFYAVFPNGMPDRVLLDQVVPDGSAAIEAYDSHTTWVNTAAFRRLGIRDDTPSPPRGEIQRDAAGRATGILKETAMELVELALPRKTIAQDVENLASAQATIVGGRVVYERNSETSR